MTQNMYRVGDCVYFEDSNAGPYNIRRIEELTKNSSGNVVEARVTVFYRRRDISAALLKIADQAERRFDEYLEEEKAGPEAMDTSGHTVVVNGDKDPDANSDGKENREDEGSFDWGYAGLPTGAEKLSKSDRYKLRLRELFLSRQIETLPASQIRGKCSVTLLSEIETPDCYEREDAYFYSLVYDPSQMSLLADKGAIRVGDKYQAEVPLFSPPNPETKTEVEDVKENEDLMIAEEEESEEDNKKEKGPIEETEREIIVYHPYHNLSEREIDQFLIIARAVGTFSRALDTSSSTKLPSLHMTAAAASRDVTIFHAMALLHQSGYDLAEGMKYLVPPPVKEHYPLDVDKATGHNTISLGGPILIRDQIEEWSAAEANLFEEALEKYGKDFSDIRNDFLPWKGMRDIVEYYYMWKTTNRYIDGRNKKISEEKEAKLKQVYIPSHNKPCANLIGQLNSSNIAVGGSVCEGCKASESVNWYAWGPAQLQLRLCQTCWNLWKRSGGLPFKHSCDRYDLEGGTDMSTVENKIISSSVNSLAINKTSAAAQNRAVGTGKLVAQLTPTAQLTGITTEKSGNALPRAPPFNLKTNLFTRVSRRITPKNVLNIRKQARNPNLEINSIAIKKYVSTADVRKVIDAAKTITNGRVPIAFTNYLKARAAALLKPGVVPVAEPNKALTTPPLPKKSTLNYVPHVFVAGPTFRKTRAHLMKEKQIRRFERRPLIFDTLAHEMLSSYYIQPENERELIE